MEWKFWNLTEVLKYLAHNEDGLFKWFCGGDNNQGDDVIPAEDGGQSIQYDLRNQAISRRFFDEDKLGSNPIKPKLRDPRQHGTPPAKKPWERY